MSALVIIVSVIVVLTIVCYLAVKRGGTIHESLYKKPSELVSSSEWIRVRQQFVGKKNSDELLRKKAELITPYVLSESYRIMQKLYYDHPVAIRQQAATYRELHLIVTEYILYSMSKITVDNKTIPLKFQKIITDEVIKGLFTFDERMQTEEEYRAQFAQISKDGINEVKQGDAQLSLYDRYVMTYAAKIFSPSKQISILSDIIKYVPAVNSALFDIVSPNDATLRLYESTVARLKLDPAS